MKHLKKLLSAILVMAMALTMALPAAAAETYSITIKNDKAGHTYEAYQIFKGDLHIDEDGKEILSNIEWGAGVNADSAEAKFGTAKVKAEALELAGEAEGFAKEVSAYLTTPSSSTNEHKENITFSDNTTGKGYVISGLEPGYYLVKDSNGTLNGDSDAYTSYILQVVGNVEARPKSAVPSVDKQVQDEVPDAEAGHSDGWGETADHAINESFQFKLTATLPADVNFADYTSYQVKFTDTMSAGVTFESIESVTVRKTENTEGHSLTDTQYGLSGVTAGQAGATWTLTINDIKSIMGNDFTQGVTVEVIYNAHLNEAAYVNNASGSTENKNAVYLEYSNNPNGEGLGKTPTDEVWVFTYEVDNSKIDGKTKEALAGAEFELYAVTKNGDKTEPGDKIPVVWDDEMQAYREAKAGEQASAMQTRETTDAAGKKHQTFSIKGLDAGEYFLKETKTPGGYNTCEPRLIKISATHAEVEGAGTTTLTQDSTMKLEIVNNKGVELPGTGGIGTTIFYVVGGILVVGAAVLLIAKKRTK